MQSLADGRSYQYRRSIDRGEEIEILECYKDPIVFFFFRGASRQGIAVKTEREMKKLQEDYDDVILKFGPV